MKSRPSENDLLRSRLKHLIADLFRLDLADADSIADDEVLIGGSLGLDSLDALELAMGVEEEFGIILAGRLESARAFTSVASLADHILAHRQVAPPVSSRPAPAFALQPSH